MKLRPAWGLAASLCVCALLGGCGSGTPVGLPTIGQLQISSGGAGSATYARGLTTGSFANSVTVAVHQSTDATNQYTIFTFFGLTGLNYRQVPQAALVVFVNGIDPAYSISTALPTPTVLMALHYFTGLQMSQGLPQKAAQVFDTAYAGAFITESLGGSSGGYVSPTAPLRQVRYSQVALRDSTTADEASVIGSTPLVMSSNIDSTFFGYCGNLGLLRKPGNSAGGPPSPPGSTTGGIGGTGGTTSGGDTPPTPPLR